MRGHYHFQAATELSLRVSGKLRTFRPSTVEWHWSCPLVQIKGRLCSTQGGRPPDALSFLWLLSWGVSRPSPLFPGCPPPTAPSLLVTFLECVTQKLTECSGCGRVKWDQGFHSKEWLCTFTSTESYCFVVCNIVRSSLFGAAYRPLSLGFYLISWFQSSIYSILLVTL